MAAIMGGPHPGFNINGAPPGYHRRGRPPGNPPPRGRPPLGYNPSLLAPHLLHRAPPRGVHPPGNPFGN